MTTTPGEDPPSNIVASRDAQWKTRWLVVGLIGLLLWRSVSFVDRGWLAQFPSSLLLIITGLAPQFLLLIFPIITRTPRRRPTFGIPGPTRCLVEFCVAIPIVIVTIVLLAAVNYLVGCFSPGTSLTPDAVANMVVSPNRMLVYFVLVFSFTFAPIAEELFFRGFLQNAFHARMPFFIASLVQCLIFGFGHFFGVTHSDVAFVLGLLLTAVYQWRKTLITPIFVHAGINSFAALGAALMMVANANGPVLGVIGDRNDTQCVIHQIVAGSAAEKANLQVGDTIMSFNNKPIRDFPHLVDTIRLYQPGDAIPVEINRSESIFEVTVLLRRRDSP
jgi:membrane protease YdiL (CAAX protease family)